MPAQHQTQPPPKTILLAEDSPEVRRLVARLLRRAGHEVLEVADGQEAWEIAMSGAAPISLLLTDLDMPRLCGPELVGRFRAMLPGVPVLCLSGGVTPGLWAQLHAPVLAKPFDANNLLRWVGHILGTEHVEVRAETAVSHPTRGWLTSRGNRY